MATEEENKCVVTVHRGVNVDDLMTELTSVGGTTPYVPQRAVKMHNEKQDSLRNFDIVLTRSEAELLKQDSRIIDVRYGTKADNGYIRKPTAIQTGVYCDYNVSTQGSEFGNWGLPSAVFGQNPFDVESKPTFDVPYTAIGENVDVVICDSGILHNHPEWLTQNGKKSRFKAVDWPTVSGLTSYIQGDNFYTDQNGHGSHVAGTVAGRYYGWARAANIYAMKIFDTDCFPDTVALNMVRAWHNIKKQTPGYNPTVMNMSWGYTSVYRGIDGGSYQGVPWTGLAMREDLGMLTKPWNSGGNGYEHPVRVASVDADVQDCHDAGIIMVAAAGNDGHLMDNVDGPNYNNYYYSYVYGQNRYYHRGSTPNVPGAVISVGCLQPAVGYHYKAYFSVCGPGVTVFAPGYGIQSVGVDGSDIANYYGGAAYPWDTNFLAVKISGTSMASPQVAGILANLAGNRRHYNTQDCKNWLVGASVKDTMLDPYPHEYNNSYAMMDSPNRILHWPFPNSNVLTMDNV